MFVNREKRCLILRLKEPDRVLSVIPAAKKIMVQSVPYVVVRHALEEVKVLRNIGINAPSPMGYYYNWPGRFKPFAAQKQAAEFMSLEWRSFNLSEMGTGKTLATLWAYDYLRSLGFIEKTLVVTPLSTMELTWADEIFTHFPHLTVSVVHGDRGKRLKLFDTDADIYLINHDGLKVKGVTESLKPRDDINLVVIDEIAQVARNAGTDRWRALQEVCNKQVPRYVWGLSGSPTPNAPTDAWAQCRIIVPDRVPLYFNRFKNTVMRQINQWVWVPRNNATELVHEVMQPSIRFTRDECMDLPPIMYNTRTAVLSKQQEKAYKEMMNKLCMEAEEGNITAANEAVKAQKLIQVACGLVYDGKGGAAALNCEPRTEVLLEIIEQSETKVIVFVPFVSVLNRVAQDVRYAIDRVNYTRHELGHAGEDNKVEIIHGSVSKNERDRIFGEFQRGKTLRVLVAQPVAMSHGLTLTAASTIVWYAPITSNDVFGQANARISRPGQKYSQNIFMIEGSEIERKYYQRLKNKQKVQGLLLDMIKDSRVSA